MAGDGKIFCVGFHKTGTTSLAAALTCLGYRVTGPNWIANPNIRVEALNLALSLVPQYDAFQDNPWPILFRELHQEFPHAKFILTIRPPDEWIRSVVQHFGTETPPMREWIYGPGHGSPLGSEEIYIARVTEHNRAVWEYFQRAPHSLLTLQITAGDGWKALCSFLDKPIPSSPFPYLNAATSRTSGVASSGPAATNLRL